MTPSPAAADLPGAQPVPDLDRLRPITQKQSRAVGWAVTLAVTALAGVMRFWNLGEPGKLLGDENYYALDSWSLWHHGYATRWVPHAGDLIDRGTTRGIMLDTPSFPVHPEVGKWLIGLGEHLFGLTPFGWRFASAVAGTLVVLLTIRLARRLTGSIPLAAVAGLLVTFDGLEFGMSRLAMLDIFLTLFVLAAVLCLVADRDWSRARLRSGAGSIASTSGWGPLLLWRPWRLAAGVFFGLAVGSKWSALFVIAAFGVVVVVWDATARRALGIRLATVKSLVLDGLPAFGYLVVAAFLVYVATWSGWLLHASVLEKTLARPDNGGPYWGSYVGTPAHGLLQELFRSLRDLWHYHQDIFRYHTETFTTTAGNFEQSGPWSWPFVGRPYWVTWVNGLRPGAAGCQAVAGSSCERGILLAGTPALWWFALVALVDAVYLWIARRDWRYSVPLVAVMAAWLPWFAFADRPTYYYYAVLLTPFLVLTATLVLERAATATRTLRGRVRLGPLAVGAFTVLVIANYAWFWPVLTDEPLTTSQFRERVWFTHWEVDGGSPPTPPTTTTKTWTGAAPTDSVSGS